MRHGESTWITEGRFQGRGDPPLSELGQRQAALLGARLADPSAIPQLPLPGGPPAGVWHSPLTRTTQTAEAIWRARPAGGDLPLTAAPEFLEIAQGVWEGLLVTEVRARYGEELAAWRRSPTTAWAPGGEPLSDVAERVRRGLGSVLDTLTDVRPGVAAEQGPVIGYPPLPTPDPDGGHPATRQSSAANAAQPAPWGILVAHDGVMRMVLMTLLAVPYERFWSWPFALCSISVLDIRGGTASLRAHNLADHLAPLEHEMRAAAEARGDRRGAL